MGCVSALHPPSSQSCSTAPKQLTSASLPEISRELGGKHHIAALQSIRMLDLPRSDKELNRTIKGLLDSAA